ncbi:MAG: hypothetical protein R6U96_03970 [Promethearchaeia archaeon]
MKTSHLKIGIQSRKKIKGKKTIVEVSNAQTLIIKLRIINISDSSLFDINIFDQVPNFMCLENFSHKPSIITSKKFQTLIWTIDFFRAEENFSIYYEIREKESSSRFSEDNEGLIDKLTDKGLVC